MNNLPQALQVASDLSERTLTFNLILKDRADIALRSCEVLGLGFRTRTSFHEVSSIDDTLVERLAMAMRKCLATIPDGAHVLSLPEFLLELPGLALSGAHVLIMESRNGARNAIFRFKEFIGAVNFAFRENVAQTETLATHAERLAINVLADICLPILNISREMAFANQRDGERPSTEMADKVHEFEFQTELLKRFIFNAGIGHADLSQAHIDPQLVDRKYLPAD